MAVEEDCLSVDFEIRVGEVFKLRGPDFADGERDGLLFGLGRKVGRLERGLALKRWVSRMRLAVQNDLA